ncbi:MAG: hypothetical protein SF029_25485 [bacterium]|nr:hypothetical protein [bacterium]
MSYTSSNSDTTTSIYHTSTVTNTYITLNAIYLGTTLIKMGLLYPGRIAVGIEGQDNFSAEGTLNRNGLLTGMAKLHAEFRLKDGQTIQFRIVNSDVTPIVLFRPHPTSQFDQTLETLDNEFSNALAGSSLSDTKSVFSTLASKHIHIEVFRPENLRNWEPQTETDVYMVGLPPV